MGYFKSTFRNFFKKQTKQSMIITLGALGVITITAFANNNNLNFKKSNEFYYDLNYHYKKNNLNQDNGINIIPMNSYQNELFGLNRNLEYTTNSSFYITKNDLEENKAPINNKINQKIYTITNEKLLNDAYNNLNPKKIAYLTFDDGPSRKTERILEILETNNVKGTFFFVGKNMEIEPTLVKEVFEEGHSIGLHSYSHNYNQLYRKEDGLIEEFDKAQAVYKDIIEEETKIIRLPFGSKPTLKKDHVEDIIENNYKFWDWNVDSNDSNSKGKNKEGVIESIKNAINSQMNELVILMHEKEQTIESLDEIIKMLKEAGYAIRPISESIDAHNYWGIK